MKKLTKQDYYSIITSISFKAKDLLEAKGMPKKANLQLATDIRKVIKYVEDLFYDSSHEKYVGDRSNIHNLIHKRLFDDIGKFSKYIFSTHVEIEYFVDTLLKEFYELVEAKEEKE